MHEKKGVLDELSENSKKCAILRVCLHGGGGPQVGHGGNPPSLGRKIKRVYMQFYNPGVLG